MNKNAICFICDKPVGLSCITFEGDANGIVYCKKCNEEGLVDKERDADACNEADLVLNGFYGREVMIRSLKNYRKLGKQTRSVKSFDE